MSIVEHRAKRSIAQNSLYWKRLEEISKQYITSDGKQLDKKQWHHLLSMKYLGIETFEAGGKFYAMPAKSTTKLKISEFTEYLMKIEVEFIEKGVALTFPDEYGLAMGRS